MSDGPTRGGVPTEVRSLARGGGINLVGAAGSAVFSFATFAVAARMHTTAQVGAFTVAIAVFTILYEVSMAGAQVGFTRFLPRDRASGNPERLVTTLRVGLGVVLAIGVVGAVVAWSVGDGLAELLGQDADGELVARHLRWMAPAIPLTAVFLAVAAATRGLGTMKPAAAVDSLGRSGLQLVLVTATGWFGAQWLGLAWALPYVLALPVLALWLARLLDRHDALGVPDPMPRREARGRFWAFSGPRGVANSLQVSVKWADTILLGAIAGAAEAGIYSIATRFLVVGSLASSAVMQVTGPRFSELITRGDEAGLRATFRTSARWVVWTVWPMYLVLATLPEPLLRLFGPEYVTAATAVTVLALATCISAACGSVDTVLLMSGRSWLSLGNWAGALVIDLGLALLLIPRYGLLGAAIAWAASIVARNVIPLLQVRHVLNVDPFGPGYVRALLTSGLVFGGGGLAVRAAFGPSITAILVLAATAGPIYLFLVARWRHHLYVAPPGGNA